MEGQQYQGEYTALILESVAHACETIEDLNETKEFYGKNGYTDDPLYQSTCEALGILNSQS